MYPEYNDFFRKQIGQERLDWLDSLPLEDELEISGIRFRLVHGRFLDPLYLSYDSDEKLREVFRFKDGRPDANGLICADSHRPFVRPLHDGYAMNTGSVGDNLGVPRAHALLLEGDTEESPLRITVLSVPYDNRKAAAIAEQYPDLPQRERYLKEITRWIM
jgi:diadenosine tetraphosphatase ApaH/serine/threonine PP2A family protein phosphatase